MTLQLVPSHLAMPIEESIPLTSKDGFGARSGPLVRYLFEWRTVPDRDRPAVLGYAALYLRQIDASMHPVRAPN